ncbi:MAG TPA: CPBP family intramembrane glutamic endopeptidase [Rudaea sp.]|nr:CPBP family intramembrane glutamic endopeptidase [Rudaea sp.]
MPHGVSWILRCCAAIALFALTAICLNQLAQWQFTAHLRDTAARDLAMAASGGTPWDWDFHRDSIVAGRVFGDAQADFSDDCLLVQSRGNPFEIGLHLPQLLPLREFPRLHLFAFANASAQARLVARERLDGGAWTSSPFPLAGASAPTDIDVEKVVWRAPDGTVQPAPAVVAMLRLRFSLPQGAVLQFNGATLERPANFERLDLSRKAALAQPGAPVQIDAIPVYRAPDGGFSAGQIATISMSSPPILELPKSPRVERRRQLLNSILDALPAAIIVPQGAIDASFAQARSEATHSMSARAPAGPRWIALILYAGGLLLARLFPPRHPRWRALLEIVLVLAGPLWLIAGGHFSGQIDAAQKFLIACVSVYSISLGFPRDWKWNGSGRGWLLASAVVALAVGIGLIVHFFAGGTMRPIGSAHVLRYFGWAMIQQYLVCVVCTSRWKLVAGSDAAAIWLGALGFALLHTPNASLMLATFAGGLCWCTLYLRERALLPLAVSHATSALALIALLPPSWLYSAEVSARFFQ